jgi:hypothetical protein
LASIHLFGGQLGWIDLYTKKNWQLCSEPVYQLGKTNIEALLHKKKNSQIHATVACKCQ